MLLQWTTKRNNCVLLHLFPPLFSLGFLIGCCIHLIKSHYVKMRQKHMPRKSVFLCIVYVAYIIKSQDKSTVHCVVISPLAKQLPAVAEN